MFAVCCSRFLRAGFLVLAAPLLLTGSLFQHLGHILQQNGVRNAEYAAAEWTAAAGLDKEAKSSIAQAEEDEAAVSELEADATRHGGEVGASEASAGKNAAVVGEDEATAATEAGTAAAVQEVPGVNVAADATEGAAILGEQASAAAAAGGFIKNEAFAAEEGAQASADEGLAAEKQTEATSLSAAAGAEEATSVAAKQQATQASLRAGGLFASAGICQLMSCAAQVPVALALLVKWSASAAAGPCGIADGIVAVNMAGKSLVLLSATWMASRLALAASVASLLAAPWAVTVLAASAGSEGIMSEVVGLAPKAASARLLSEASHKHKVEEPSLFDRLNPFARHDATTTAHPPTTPAPPNSESQWEMVVVAARATLEPIFRWALPVLIDVGLVSAVFAAAALAMGAGRHAPAIKRGRISHRAALSAASREVVAHWLWGLALLVAIWVLSIILAKELRPVASFAQRFHVDVSSDEVMTLAFVCLVAHIAHGYLLSDNVGREPEGVKSHEQKYNALDLEASGSDGDGAPGPGAVAAVGAASCALALVGAVTEMGLQAIEGPVNAWAIGGSYKAVVMFSAFAAVTPWPDVAKGAQLWLHSTPPVLVAVYAILAVLLTGVMCMVLAGFWRWLTRIPPEQARESSRLTG